MIQKAPYSRPVLTPFHNNLQEELKDYWRCAQRFHSGTGNYDDANGQAMLAAEKHIMKKLGFPNRSFLFSDPIQRFGLEPYCYPELVVQCANKLIRMAESYLLSPAKGARTLLHEALENKTPGMELFAELDMPTTSYLLFLYYEYFLTGHITVSDFLTYMRFIQQYRTPHGREIPFDVAGLRHKRMLQTLFNENLWYFEEYVAFLRYNEEIVNWERLEHGIDCEANTNLIVDTLFISRIEHKLSYNDIRIEAIVPIQGTFHEVTVYCNGEQFNQLMEGARYHQYSARILEGINIATESKEVVYALNMQDIINKCLEINGCFLELCIHTNSLKSGRARTKQYTFQLVDVDLRSSNSSLIDD